MYYVFYVLFVGFMNYGYGEQEEDIPLQRQQRMEKFNSYFQEVKICDESAQKIIDDILSVQDQTHSIEEVCHIENVSTLDQFEKCIENKSQWVLEVDHLIEALNRLKESCPVMSVSTKRLEDFQSNLKHRYNYIERMYNDALEQVKNSQTLYQRYKPRLCKYELDILRFNMGGYEMMFRYSNVDIIDLYMIHDRYNRAQVTYDRLVEIGKLCGMEHVESVLESHELISAIDNHLKRINNIDFLDWAGKTCNFLEENNIDTLNICEDPRDNSHWRYTLHLLSRQYYEEKKEKG